jgi:lipoprotein-anchoring transpeptidase ErfK/SrfK
MRSFVLGMLIAAVVCLLWVFFRSGPEVQGGSPAAAQAAPVENQAGFESLIQAGSAAEPVAQQPAAPQPGAQQPAPPQQPAPLAEVAVPTAAPSTAAPADIGACWRELADPAVAPGRRAAVAAALAALPVANLEQAMVKLGATNATLRSDEGRQVLRRAAELAASLPDEQSVVALSRLVERLMQGPVDRANAHERGTVDQVYGMLKERVDRWVCNPSNVTRARSYKVQSGDSLARIATRFRKEGVLVEEGTLQVLNRIRNPKALQVGQQIKIPVDPIHTVVEKRSYLMAVYLGDVILRLYWVGHGAGDNTPLVEFRIADKLKDPQWYSPVDGNVYPYGHPKNILGKYFVKFAHDAHPGFGAHGTPMPETIGTMSSLGCIRMLDPDIEEFFTLIPRDSKVVVRAST